MMVDPMSVGPGTAITPNLTLVRPLRDGAMGSVWIAERGPKKRKVAVKFISSKQARDKATLVRFNREADAASRINSPNVVKMLEHGTTEDGMPFIAMELLRGETLGERLERVGRLSLDDTAAIVSQVGNALDAAHEQAIIHRDIKPDNIFLVGEDDFPLVKVLDFGMAKQTGPVKATEDSMITATGVAVGTPEYMSPEQVLGSKDVDHRSDLWALGVVTYRCVAGVVPFAGETPHALFFGICKGEYTPLQDVGGPDELDSWVRRSLRPPKDQRFNSAREMVVEYERAIALALANPFDGEDDEDDDDDDDESTQLMDISKLRAASAPPPLPESQRPPPSLAPEEEAPPPPPFIASDPMEMTDPIEDPETFDIFNQTNDLSDEEEAPCSLDDNEKTTDLAPQDAAAFISEALEQATRRAEAAKKADSDQSSDADETTEVLATDFDGPPSADGGPTPKPTAAPARAASSDGGRKWAVYVAAAVAAGVLAVAIAHRVKSSLAPTTAADVGSAQTAQAPTSSRTAAPLTTAAQPATSDEAPETASQTASASDSLDPEMDAGAADEETDSPDASADETGEVTIICSPPCSQVRWNGKALGSTPSKHTMPAGRQQITVSRVGGVSKVIYVEVIAGKHLTRRIPMDDTPGVRTSAPVTTAPPRVPTAAPKTTAAATKEWTPDGL